MLIRKSEKYRSNHNVILLLQLIASIAWMASVFVYGSFALGDYLQLIAASAWTAANIYNFFKS